ncbi:MAG TPA: hypothetical protein VNA89_04520 [Gemmatimonadaceae bacterium]|nr:hypothetical protein [Gemmatimonadaceae bacterium]
MRRSLSPVLALAAALVVGACRDDRPDPAAPDADAASDARAATSPGVRVYQFRTEEDAALTAAGTANDFCASAPFAVNVKLNAYAWSHRTRASDGLVVNEDARRLGVVVACARLTDFAFPPGLQQNFYAQFRLPAGTFTALGTCTLISNDVPRAGLVLAGCTLRVAPAPGIVGGAATSLSVFNPFRLPGFNTGSYWTIQVYEAGA